MHHLKKPHLVVITALLLITLASLGAAYLSFRQLGERNWEQLRLKGNGTSASSEDTRALVLRVGKHIVLPADEEPTVATVTDPERLRSQPFFARAEVGYKVLIYTKARKAILYDPVSDKIVEVAPINTK